MQLGGKGKNEPPKREAAAEPEPALLPLATAREAARVEMQRWQHVHSVLRVAATVEETEAEMAKREGDARARAETAEREADEAVTAAQERTRKAEQDSEQRIRKLELDADRATTETNNRLQALETQVSEVQAELIQIERDRTDSAAKAKAEIDKLMVLRDELRSEIEALRQKFAAA